MTAVIEAKGLTKRYGASLGVENIDLTVPKGSIFGFLGPNGAGKTTTISMLVNLIQPTSGQLKVFGLDVTERGLDIRRRLGFLSSDMALDRGLSGWQQLEYFGNLRGQFDEKYVRSLAQRLDCNLTKKFKQLSRGNKQKVGLIAALMHKPELLVLDEPTSGLDPLIQAEFNKIVLDHKQKGGTVFISSHVLSEVQEICDQVAFIRAGKLVAARPLKEITHAAPKRVAFSLQTGRPEVVLKQLEGVIQPVIEGKEAKFTFTGDQQELISRLAQAKLVDVHIEDADLESIFMQYYEGEDV